jgi:hypothetical protein
MSTGRLAPFATTIAVVIDPAVAAVMHDIRAADHAADYATNDCAGRSSNDGTSASTNGDAFQRSGMGRDGRSRQHQCEYSSLEDGAHDNLLG